MLRDQFYTKCRKRKVEDADGAVAVADQLVMLAAQKHVSYLQVVGVHVAGLGRLISAPCPPMQRCVGCALLGKSSS